MTTLLLRNVRLVPIGAPAPAEPVDVRVAGSHIVAVGADLPAEPTDRVLRGDGRWCMPGLWDQHVHALQWAQTRTRLDVSGTSSAEAVLRIVADHLRADDGTGWVFGFGFRSATWDRTPTVADLDSVTGARPVVLTSGDAHNGWLNSAALAALGVGHVAGPLTEATWFDLLPRVVALTEATDDGTAIGQAIEDAAARGVVGLVDFEMAAAFLTWPDLSARGLDHLRVRPAVYPELLDEVIAAGLRRGSLLTPDGRVTMGPLKIISDGSLNTRTAFCHAPYAGGTDRGVQNHDLADLTDLLGRATAAGLDVAVHAIGDAAVHDALAAFGRTGAHGSIEHAQLMTSSDIATMARLGVRASVQPAHLLDDRDPAAMLWPDRTDRCFPLRSLVHAGVDVVLGSDAPVAPLDPWAAMAAAVHRSGDDRAPWNAAESLTVAEALAASVDGQRTLATGSRSDLVLLDRDPLAQFDDSASAAAHLHAVTVEATLCDGQIIHGADRLGA